MLAVYYANLGTVEQTRLELTAYDPRFFYKDTMDNARLRIDLGGAEGNFQRALDSDPQNETALQRLLEIALSRGEYDRARVLADSLMKSGRDDFVSRSLIGDALVADLDGDLELAANTLRDVPWARFHLGAVAWYRYFVAKPPDYPRAARAWSAILLLNPGDQDASYWRNEALRLAR
jgi:tetratricopeptide (TPR) repeat protein